MMPVLEWLDIEVVWFNEGDLRRRAGNIWYVRGLDYVNQVDELRWAAGELTATVHGSEEYRVRLLDDRRLLTGHCSCPWGQKGNFCKHCVAVGLAGLAAAPSEPAMPPPPSVESRTETAVDLRAYLTALDHAALVDLLLESAAQDPALHWLLSSRARPDKLDPTELRPMVDLLRSTGRLNNDELTRLDRAADQALRILDAFAAGHPVLIGPLYQRALEYLTAPAYEGHPDDALSKITDAVARTVDGIIAAYRGEPPDPVEFARWLIDVQVKSSRFRDLTAADFAEILGDEGLAIYWQQLSNAADTVNTDDYHEDEDSDDKDEDYDEDEDEDEDDYYAVKRDRRRRVIFQLQETYLADVVKDTDRLIDFYAANLSDSRRYIQIGETLRTAERFDEAISWLRRGLSEARWGRTEICELLVAVYTQAGRLREAARTRMDNFTHDPNEYNYRMLLHAAEPLDAVPYAEQKAMDFLRERAARGGWGAADPLVTILIAIRDIDRAWAAAQEFGCSNTCMFLLARNRAKDHPADAIPVFAREVETAIARKDRSGYAKAADLLVTMRDLYQQAGRDFNTYLDQVKATHRRKSAFMEYLGANRL